MNVELSHDLMARYSLVAFSHDRGLVERLAGIRKFLGSNPA